MSLRPRHYLLIALLLALGVYNLWRRHRSAAAAVPPPPAVTHVTTAPPAQTPAWTAFDHAASLRDAPDATFQPALTTLHQLAPNDLGKADLSGCITWLDFYRQGVLHPSRDPQWKDRSQRHLNGCVTFHLDTTAG